MCGRFVLEASPDQLMDAYRLTSPPVLNHRYNIAPSQQVVAVRQNKAETRELVQLRWGLIPSWAKDTSIGHKMINARSETAYEKPSFKQALRTRRCLIPANGFYEWEKVGKEKIPHYIRLRGGDLMAMAGLWESWKSPTGELIETCTVLTTTANALVKKIHDRMPVLLHNDEFNRWLSRDNNDIANLAELFLPYPSDLLEEYVVSNTVNHVSTDSPACILPVQ